MTSNFVPTINGRSVDITYDGNSAHWFAQGFKYRVSPSNTSNHLICDLPDLESPPWVDSGAVWEFSIPDPIPCEGC